MYAICTWTSFLVHQKFKVFLWIKKETYSHSLQVILIALAQLGTDQCFCLWHVFYRTFHCDYSLQIKAVDVIDAVTIALISHYFMYVSVKQQQMSTPCYIAAQSSRNYIVKFLNISIHTSKFPSKFKVRTNFNMGQPQKCPFTAFLVTGSILFTLLPSHHNSMLWRYKDGNTWKIIQYFGRLKNIKMVAASYLTLLSTVVSFWGCDFSYTLTLK